MSLRGTESWPGTLHVATTKGGLVECVTLFGNQQCWISTQKIHIWVKALSFSLPTHAPTHTLTHLQEQLSNSAHLFVSNRYKLVSSHNTLWRRSTTPIVRKRKTPAKRDEKTTQSHTASNGRTGFWTQICHTLPVPFHQATLLPSTMLPLPQHFWNSFLKSYPENPLILVWITWTR